MANISEKARRQVRAAQRQRRSRLLGTSDLVGPDDIRGLGPDEPREPSGGRGGLLGALGDAAGFLFEDVPALGLQTALALAQNVVDPLRGAETTTENFLRAVGVNVDFPDLPSTGVRVPGVLPQGSSLDPSARAEEARTQQDLELGQELFTAPLLGKVTPAGIGRVVADPWNVVPLPIGMVGKAARAAPGAGLVGSVGRAATSRQTLLGQAVGGVREAPEFLKTLTIRGPAAVGRDVTRRIRGLPNVDRVVDKNVATDEILRKNRPALVVKNLEELTDEVELYERLSLLGRTPVLGKMIQGSFNRLRGRLPRNAEPDEASAIISEGARMGVTQEYRISLALTQFEEALHVAKFNKTIDGGYTVAIKHSDEADAVLGKRAKLDMQAHRNELARWEKAGKTWRGRLTRGAAPAEPPKHMSYRSIRPGDPQRTYTFENYGDMIENLDIIDGLTLAQREAIDIGNGWLDDANNFLLSTGAKRDMITPSLGQYFPRRVIGKETGEEFLEFAGVQISRSGKIQPSAKAGASHLRRFESAAQDVAAGYRLENDPVRVLGTYMRGSMHEGLDRYVDNLVSEIEGAVIGRTAGAGKGIFRKAVLAEDEAKRLTRAFEDPSEWAGPVGVAMRGLQRFNQVAVPLMTTLDLSGSMIQGGMSLFSHPVAWMRAMGIATASLADPRYYRRWALNEEDLLLRAQNQGGVVFLGSQSSSEFIFRPPAALRRVAGQSNILGAATRKAAFAPKMANLHFSRFGNILRAELWKGVEKTAAPAGKKFTDQELRGMGGVINNMTGVGVNGFGKGGGAFIFAPRFFRGQLDLLDKAIADGTVAGDLARESISRYFVLGAMTTKFINDAHGEETVWDPTDPNFMRIRGLNRDISLFGTYDTLFRALAKVPEDGFEGAVGAVAQLAEGKASPAIGRMIDVFQGYNWDGKSIQFDSLDNIANSFQLMAREQLPIGLSNIGEETYTAVQEGVPIGDILAGAAVEILGTKSAPLSVGDQFAIVKDQAAVAVGEARGEMIPDYDALVDRVGNYEANTLIRNFEPLRQLEEESTIEQAARSRSGALSDMGQYFLEQGEIKARQLGREELLQDQVITKRITRTEYRKKMSDSDHDASIEIEQLARNPRYAAVIGKFKESSHPVDQAVAGYFDLYDQASAETGWIDYAALDGLRESYRLEIGEDMNRRVEGAIMGRRRDTVEGEKLRLAKQRLRPFHQFAEQVFRVEKENDPKLQAFASLSHLEAVIRNTAMEINPYEVDSIVTKIRSQIPALVRLRRLEDRFKRRMRSNPLIMHDLKTYYG